MPKTIETLIEDMQGVLRHDTPSLFLVNDGVALGSRVAAHVHNSLNPRDGERKPHRVWFSQLGARCPRKVWYDHNKPELAAPIDASLRYKFLYGNVVEEITLSVAKASGHHVEREQEKIEVPIGEVNGIEWSLTGRIDAVIDGHVVDVKSMSTYSFKDMPDDISVGGHDDPFGYRTQLGGYQAIIGSPGKFPALLCVDKQLGHIKLAYDKSPPALINILAMARFAATTASMTTPPGRMPTEDMGAYGNKKLGTVCSYCAYKKACWPGLRTFLYSSKPVFLTEVKAEPKVPELHDDAPEETS